jgi:hypothetical protein
MGEVKICTRCHQEKDETHENFLLDRRTGKFRAECRMCAAEKKRQRRKVAGSLENQRAREVYWKNRSQRLSPQLKYFDSNAERVRERRREIYRNRMGNDPNFRAQKNSRSKKYRSDPSIRVSCSVSKQIWRSLREIGGKRGYSWEDLVGYSKDELCEHLERQFQTGMSWENYGDWHIDHIVPKSSFEFSTVRDPDFKRCWALTNLRPLWAKENISKGAKIQFWI